MKRGYTLKRVVQELKDDGMVISHQTVHNIKHRVGKERLAETLGRKHAVKRRPIKATADVVRRISKLIKYANPITKGIGKTIWNECEYHKQGY